MRLHESLCWRSQIQDINHFLVLMGSLQLGLIDYGSSTRRNTTMMMVTTYLLLLIMGARAWFGRDHI